MLGLKSRILLLLIFLASVIQAQESTKRVLVIPFGRFDFQSQFSLDKIAYVNDISNVDLVVDTYLNHFISTSSKEKGQLELFRINEDDLKVLLTRVSKEYKSRPTSHYGVNIDLLKKEEIDALLTNYSADYILFLTQYSIRKKVIVAGRNFDGNKFIPWSLHEVDYELYDKELHLVAIGDAVSLEPRKPTEENYLSNGLILQTLERAFSRFPEDVYNKILAFQTHWEAGF